MNIDKYKKLIPNDPGIQGRDEYFNSSVLVLITQIDNKEHFIFQKRSQHIRQGGEICFPGGKVDEKDKSVLETALRETEEELGIDRKNIKIVGQMHTVIAAMGVIVDSFLGFVEAAYLDDMTINKEEVADVFIIPFEAFKVPEEYAVRIEVQPTKFDYETNEEIILLPVEELGLPQRYTKPWGGFEQRVLVYQTSRGVVWGLTARLVHEVISKY